MGTIDIIILVCLLPSLYFGLKNGLVKQIISFAVIYLGITLSLKFSGLVEPLVQQYLHIEGFWAKFIAFVAIFAAVALVLSLLGNIIDKAIKVKGVYESSIMLDKIKAQGYQYSTVSGITVSVFDAIIPENKAKYLAEAQEKVDKVKVFRD